MQLLKVFNNFNNKHKIDEFILSDHYYSSHQVHLVGRCYSAPADVRLLLVIQRVAAFFQLQQQTFCCLLPQTGIGYFRNRILQKQKPRYKRLALQVYN